jgi:hypothetical protein
MGKTIILMFALPTLLAITLAFVLTIWRRFLKLVPLKPEALIAGSNFPPGVPPIGTVETFALTGLVAAVTTKTIYTAQVSGLYLVGQCTQIVSTNKAGSIATTLGTPHAGNIVIGVAPAAPGDTQTAIEQDPALGGSTAIDGFSAMIPVWMNTGDTLTIAAAVSGLTGTVFNLFAVVQRVL